MPIRPNILCKASLSFYELFLNFRVRVILKFVMITYLTLVALLMLADCISYMRIHENHAGDEHGTLLSTKEADHFRKHHNMHM